MRANLRCSLDPQKGPMPLRGLQRNQGLPAQTSSPQAPWSLDWQSRVARRRRRNRNKNNPRQNNSSRFRPRIACINRAERDRGPSGSGSGPDGLRPRPLAQR